MTAKRTSSGSGVAVGASVGVGVWVKAGKVGEAWMSGSGAGGESVGLDKQPARKNVRVTRNSERRGNGLIF
jgi:hypothetical protein